MQDIINNIGNREVFLILYNNHICLRCILRFFRIQVYELYRDKAKYIQLIGSISQHQKLQPNLLSTYNFLGLIKNSQDQQYCRLCLGLLQYCDTQKNVKEIADKIKQSKFEFEKFKFAIKVPNSTLIRYNQAVQFIKAKLNESKNQIKGKNIINNWRDNHIQVKTTLKWILAPLISKQLESQSTIQDESLQVNLNYQNTVDQIQYFNKFYGVLRSIATDKLQKKLDKIQKKMKTQKLQNLKSKIQHIESSAANLNKILAMNSDFFFTNILKSEFCDKVVNPCQFKIQIRCTSIFLFGYYVKYSRYLSQTPWVVNNIKLTESSIQEQLEKILLKYFYPPQFQNSQFIKFHSGGRQDIDVRMLSNGRPFAIQFCSPRFNRIQKSQNSIMQLQQQINLSKYIKVNSLKYSNQKCLQILKKSEIQKIKAYSCFVHFSKKISQKDIQTLNAVVDLVIDQKTPLRVLHRRTLMIRNKIIHRIKAVPIDDQNIILNILSSAGTYIKEFVHGDLQRTTPNVGSLTNNQADIFQLDVLKIYEKLDQSVVQDFLNVPVNFSQQ